MDHYDQPLAKKNWFPIFWILLGILLAGGMIYLLATRQSSTQLETGLITLILTAASTGISYFATKMYAEQTYKETLRDQGVQIARGIMELKGQIETLADWVTQKRLQLSQSADINDGTETTLEHVELTLQGFRGMTARAVGGIAGVIGGAFAEYETFLDQVSRIRGEGSERTYQIEERMQNAASAADLEKLASEIETIRNETERKVSQLAKSAALPVPLVPQKRSFAAVCPICGAGNACEMPERIGETRVLICKSCGEAFNAHLVSPQRVVTRKLPRPGEGPVAPEVENVLRQTDGWIAPDTLESLMAAALNAHRHIKKCQQEPSAENLQNTVLGEVANADPPISKVTVRRFFKLVFFGRAFKFAEGVPPRFKSPYTNDLDEKTLLVAFVGQCVYRLANFLPLGPEGADKVARVLFGSCAHERCELVRQTMIETIARKAKLSFEEPEHHVTPPAQAPVVDLASAHLPTAANPPQ
jgi:hypothetical protein